MHHSSVVYNGSLWVFGGRTPDLTGLSDLHRYDICNYFSFLRKLKQTTIFLFQNEQNIIISLLFPKLITLITWF